MTINGISGANTQTAQMGMNQAMDSYSRNIQNQIANAQKQLQELSSNEEMTLEEKMKKRQEIQQQISDLNMQFRQHQIEQRRAERSEKQQAKGSSVDDMLGGKSANADSRSAGISQANMAAMISADTSLKQAKIQGNVASAFEGRAGVLEIEIKLDEARATGGKTANTEGKKAELAEVEQKAMDVTKAQAETLGEANKALEEAKKADEQATDKDTKATGAEEEKAKDNVSKNEQPDSVHADSNKTDKDTDVSEPLSDAEVPAEQQSAVYAHVDVRL